MRDDQVDRADAAAQAARRHGDDTILRMRLRFLADGEADPHALFAAHAVARVFAASGLDLPSRHGGGVPDPAHGGTPRLLH